MINPPSKLGVGRIPLCDEAVAELHLEFTQLSEEVASLRVTQSSTIINSFKSHCIETWLVLVLDLAISSLSLVRPLFGLVCVTLSHSER